VKASPLPALFCLLCSGVAAFADTPAVPATCQPDPDARLLLCEVSNPYPQAIASVAYAMTAAEEGRTVPWGQGSGRLDVPGGIEPKETVTLAFPLPDLPPRAKGRAITFRLDALDAFGVRGKLLRPPSGAAARLNMTAAQGQVVGMAVRACWNTGALSAEALRTTVLISFDIGAAGKLDASSIKLLESSGGTPEAMAQAYEAARRAIIRCGARGFDLPEQRGKIAVEMVFDASNLIRD